MANLPAPDRKRLAAILGMLGSNAPGERENAARLAEQFRRHHGLTWADLLAMLAVLSEKPSRPAPADAAAAWTAAWAAPVFIVADMWKVR